MQPRDTVPLTGRAVGPVPRWESSSGVRVVWSTAASPQQRLQRSRFHCLRDGVAIRVVEHPTGRSVGDGACIVCATPAFSSLPVRCRHSMTLSDLSCGAYPPRSVSTCLQEHRLHIFRWSNWTRSRRHNAHPVAYSGHA